MNIGKTFEDVLNPIVEKYNKENTVKCRVEVEEAKLWGVVFDGTLFEVKINYIIAPQLNKPIIKKHPIGEDNQTAVIRGVKEKLIFDNFKLELTGGIKKDFIKKGVIHSFKYKVVLDGVPQIVIKEPVVKEPVVEEIKEFKKKLKEVKNGKNRFNS